MRSKLLSLLGVLITMASLLAILADNQTTTWCIARFNWLTAGELNPLTRLMIREWGLMIAMLANAFWSSTLVLWLEVQFVKHRAWLALVFMIGVVLVPRSYAAWNNYHLYQALTH